LAKKIQEKIKDELAASQIDRPVTPIPWIRVFGHEYATKMKDQVKNIERLTFEVFS
jgi:hypothetical protein